MTLLHWDVTGKMGSLLLRYSPKFPWVFTFMCPICGKFPWIILPWLASWPACGMITCDRGTEGATMAEWAVTSPTSIQPHKPDYEHTSVSFVYINHVMWFLMLLCPFCHLSIGKMGWNSIDWYHSSFSHLKHGPLRELLWWSFINSLQ